MPPPAALWATLTHVATHRPQPDPTTQRKQQNTRDPHNPSDTPTTRRPSLFEARHISRGSNSGAPSSGTLDRILPFFTNSFHRSHDTNQGLDNPEDIILGPPKTAFASSRIGGKGSFDLTDRSTRPGDSEEKSDRFNFRDRFSKDKDIIEKDLDRRDGKPGLNGRRGEKEDWNAGRPRRTFGPEDPERRPRRTGEFDRWENRENPREANADRGTRDREARFAKKDGPPGRAKFEGSWFRDEHGHHDMADGDEDKPLRNREWRRDRHPGDRDWARGAKIEQDPEWMDSNDHDESRRAHTQEDFQRWKERMKAGSGATQQAAAHEERDESHEEPSYASHHHEHQIDTPSKNAYAQSDDPFMPNPNSMDRFFGMLGDTKAAAPQEVSPPIPMDPTPKKEVPGGKSGKASRFAGLFSPTPDSPASAPEPQLPAGPQSGGTPVNPHDADQEGFQRILMMLGGGGGAAAAGGRSNSGTPSQVDAQRHMYPAPGQVDPSLHSHPMPRPIDPATTHGHPTSPPAISRQGFTSPPTDRQGFASPPADRDHLLRLMQQVRIGPSSAGNPLQAPNAGPAPPPGLMPEMLARPPPGLGPQKVPNFLDDPAIANMQRPDSEQLRRRPPPGFFDEAPFPQGNQGPMTPGGSRPHQGPNQPQMLPRPPGLEHLPPPGWTGQPPPSQQQGNGMSHMVPPPPGIPTPNRGMNPGFPPGMMPMPGNMPPMNDRNMLPMGDRNMPPMGDRNMPPMGDRNMPPMGDRNMPPMNDRQGFPRGPPPGMMPPPGYMGAPPPPGFPPMPPNPEAMMGLGPGPGNQGPYGPGNPGPQGPSSSRHLLDMLGQPGGADVRGGMVGPGQFR